MASVVDICGEAKKSQLCLLDWKRKKNTPQILHQIWLHIMTHYMIFLTPGWRNSCSKETCPLTLSCLVNCHLANQHSSISVHMAASFLKYHQRTPNLCLHEAFIAGSSFWMQNQPLMLIINWLWVWHQSQLLTKRKLAFTKYNFPAEYRTARVTANSLLARSQSGNGFGFIL